MTKVTLTDTTKKYKKLAIFYLVASIGVTFGPLLFYLIKGYIEGTEASKYTMSAMCVVAVIIFAVNILFRKHLRSPMWILLIGIYVSVQKIETLLIILAITTVLDEFWFAPSYRFCRNKWTINKEIDKRNPVIEPQE